VVLIAVFIAAVLLYGAYSLKSGGSKNDLLVFERNGNTNALFESAREKDSDGDGLYDWEEMLWGTDPGKKDSDGDGVEDGAYVAQKRAAVQTESALNTSVVQTTDKEYTLTDVVLSDSVSAFLELQNNGSADEKQEELKNALAQKIRAEGYLTTNKEIYEIGDLDLVESSPENLERYLGELLDIFDKFSKNYPGDDLVFIQNFVDFGTGIEQFTERISLYKDLAKTLMQIKVPAKISNTHTAMANTYIGIAGSLENISFMLNDPIRGIAGMMQLQFHIDNLSNQYNEINSFFTTMNDENI